MQLLVGTMSKGQRWREALRRGMPEWREERIDRAVAQGLPWPTSATTDRWSWTAPSGRISLRVLTNEPDGTSTNRLRTADGGHVAWSGYAYNTGVGGRDLASARANGCYAAIAVNDDHLTAWTNIHRMQPLYTAESDDFVVVSSSARIAGLLAGLDDGIPEQTVLGLAGPGFMLSDTTPFPGVHAVAPGTLVEVGREGLRSRPHGEQRIDRAAPLEEHAAAVATELLAAAQGIARDAPDLQCQITGGKDSRLVLAAFAEVGARPRCTTTGRPDHPDVLLGSAVTKRLGLPHETIVPQVQEQPETSPTRVINLEQRAWKTLFHTDGMLTVYEAGVSDPNAPFRSVVKAGGHGGELLRGGYGYRLRRLDADQALRRLELVAAPHASLVTDRGGAVLDAMLQDVRRRVEADPGRGLERFYRWQRAGRWHAAARSVYTLVRPERTLLGDDQVVRLASGAPQDLAWDERLFHAVLEQINPGLCELPFYHARWRFEEDGPTEHFRPETWEERAPLEAAQRSAVFNWRTDYPAFVQDRFVEAILSSPAPFFELFDRDAVTSFLDETRSARTGQQAKLVWSLFSAQQLLAGRHLEPAPPTGEELHIEVPV